MRKLASIREIAELNAIEGADAIEVALVDGWEVVVKKGEFKVGDKCVYIEIDSIVPPKPEFEFLEKRKYRIRTIKLRKQVSQGIVFKLSDLTSYTLKKDYPLGYDLTEELGIEKYDPQLQKEKKMMQYKKHGPIHKFMLRFKWYRDLVKPKGKWPNWITKTDEERVQNITSIVRRNQDVMCYATEKLDGQSASYSLKKKKGFLWFKSYLFTVCSRNIWLKRKPVDCKTNNYWWVAEKYNLEKNMKELGKELVIQGEILCDGVQKNKYDIAKDDIKFRVFNIYDIERDTWLGFTGIRVICRALELKHVPLVWSGELKELGTTPKEIVEKSKGRSVLKPSIHREGIVVRQVMSETGKRGLSFKAINPDFLLKYNE